MKRDSKVYLHDIQEASEHVRKFTMGMSLQDYRKNDLVKAYDAHEE